MPETIAIEVTPGESVTSLVYSAAERAPVLILGHGAGANQTSEFMSSTATHLAARGITVATFNFLYTERKKRAPDRPNVLEATWRAVLSSTRARHPGARLFCGGKSMGGRIASQVASDPDVARDLAGLVFLGYPLHPPAKPTQLRSKHLPQITCPMLFIQGARDPFGTEEEMAPLVAGLAQAELVVIKGGDHSFRVPKKIGPPQPEVFAAIGDAIVRWIGARAGV